MEVCEVRATVESRWPKVVVIVAVVAVALVWTSAMKRLSQQSGQQLQRERFPDVCFPAHVMNQIVSLRVPLGGCDDV